MLNDKASINVVFRYPINYKYASICPVQKKKKNEKEIQQQNARKYYNTFVTTHVKN